ncbi:small membrane protein [Munia coronavirus HKU13-3514]|uniref:Small membrane protein n=1 Tax=Munia coronavirus HKU13 TaxID=1297661 RepID=B6VDY8_9NIDO|nr:small membrane protein [Munia coronavirus HKU13-3514]ACJ12063.1 small membrane protein [Munia coronavirus HKU13-3514]
MVAEDWAITIPGQYVVATLAVLSVCVCLLFINTCLACAKLSYKCFLGAKYLVNPIIVYYSKPQTVSDSEFVKLHQFPRNNYV